MNYYNTNMNSLNELENYAFLVCKKLNIYNKMELEKYPIAQHNQLFNSLPYKEI